MGQERELTILYHDARFGFFYIQQHDSNAGTAYRCLKVPCDVFDYDTYYKEHEAKFDRWEIGWYSEEIKNYMTR